LGVTNDNLILIKFPETTEFIGNSLRANSADKSTRSAFGIASVLFSSVHETFTNPHPETLSGRR
jgi:hypothetical protein